MASDHKAEKSGRSSPLQTGQVVIGLLVSIFGSITAWQAHETSSQLQQIEQEVQRGQEFAKRIQEQLPNLTDKSAAKARISLASLYSLAEDDQDRLILFTVAIVSDNPDLRQTIADLILSDASASAEFKKDIEAKLQKRLTAQSREIATQDQGTQEQTDKINRTATEVRLLQQLTAERPTINGWVYLGKVRRGTNALADDKTIKANTLPSVGTTIEAGTSINLRDRDGRRGNIIGVIGRNSKLKVQELKRYPINSSFEAVWARVNRDENRS